MDKYTLKYYSSKKREELEKILAENNRNIYKDETFDIIRYLLDKKQVISPSEEEAKKNDMVKLIKETKGNIMYCTNCGKEVDEAAVACTKCGYAPKSENKFCYNCGAEINEKQVMCIKCGAGLTGEHIKENSTEAKDESTIGGLGILCFLIPILGLILYLVWKDEKPIKAKGAGNAAIWGVIIGFVLYFIGFCSLGALAY